MAIFRVGTGRNGQAFHLEAGESGRLTVGVRCCRTSQDPERFGEPKAIEGRPMPRKYPTVTFSEEGMREGMQIEDSNISVDDKIRLLDALGETGIKHIVVGSFSVSCGEATSVTLLDKND